MLRRNILIFHMGALGDFVVTWPLTLALGRMFAQSRIIYVTHASKGKLAEKVLRVESIDAEAGWHQLHSDTPILPEAAEKLLRGAQAIFSFASKPGDQWTKSVHLFTDAPITHIETKPADAPPIHVTQLISHQLPEQIRPGVESMMRSIETRGVGLNRKPGPDVVIHPGGGAREKCWAIERFMELIERLKQRGNSVRVLIGEVEKDRWSPETLKRLASSANVRQPATFIDLLDEISTASVFIGNDSGPGHLAGIIGIPTVSIFGSDPTRWKPIGPDVRAVHGESLEHISVDNVLRAMK